MGILSSIFGKKQKTEEQTKKAIVQNKDIDTVSQPVFHLRGKPDVKGLFPSELVMLAVAEKYNTVNAIYPTYLTTTYEVVNPLKMLKSLEARGFIRVGDVKDALVGLKLSELKEIASSVGVTPKGKKADLVYQLSEFPKEELEVYVKDRKWKLTFEGQTALKANPYIQYFLAQHSYDVTQIGITIWTVNEEFVKNPKQFYRDIIYQQINIRQLESEAKLQKNSGSGSLDAHVYCECSRIMALFVEEEGKSYVNAASLYFQYIFKRINIEAGLRLLKNYCLMKEYTTQYEMIRQYYDDIKFYPFQRTELLRLIDELGTSENEVRSIMLNSFKHSGDTGIMTESEAADFVVFELSGETDKAMELADKLARKALKKIK